MIVTTLVLCRFAVYSIESREKERAIEIFMKRETGKQKRREGKGAGSVCVWPNSESSWEVGQLFFFLPLSPSLTLL